MKFRHVKQENVPEDRLIKISLFLNLRVCIQRAHDISYPSYTVEIPAILIYIPSIVICPSHPHQKFFPSRCLVPTTSTSTHNAMSSYKEEHRGWTAVRTSSFINPSSVKDNDVVTTPTYGYERKDSIRTMENNRISAISSRTKSIDVNLNNNNGSPPSRAILEEKKLGSNSSVNMQRKNNSMSGGIILKTTSATCIATSNFNYPVVSVEKVGDPTPRSSVQITPNETQGEDTLKAQKREHLRTQRDNLNWDLASITNTSTPPLERKESTSWKPILSKGADIEGLMTKVWNKQYKEAELYISSMSLYPTPTSSMLLTLHLSIWC